MIRLALLALLLGSTSALAQSVQQSGSMTPGHPVKWITTGVVGDAGTAANGSLSGIGVTASGPSICANSGPITGPYNQLCLGVTSISANISLTNFGGASGGLTFTTNGVVAGFPTVTLPTTVNGQACFSNTSGNLSNCGTSTTLTVGSSVIASGANHQLLYDNAGVLGEVTAGNSGVLVTDVAGVPSIGTALPFTVSVATGGTGLTGGTSGGVPYFSSSSTMASSAALTVNQIMLGGGAGAAPTTFACATATTVVHGGTPPTCAQITLTADVTGVLPIANGGTAQATAPLARGSTGLNIDEVTTFGNASYVALITDRTIATASGTTFSTTRTVTLPLLSTYNAGQQVVIVDSGGAINGANALQISANAADTINGGASISITTQYGGAVLWPIGTNKWAFISAASGGGTVNTISVGGGLSTGTGASISVTGTLYSIDFPKGRLTLTTATPVLTANATAQGTLYYDCYVGNTVPYYTGTDDKADTIASCEVSTVMVSAASAGQVVSGKVYDVWWEGNTHHNICIAMSASTGGGVGWPANTARSGIAALDYTTRPYITNANTIANCFNAATNYGSITANKLTYLGTIYATANGQTGMNFNPAAAAGGTANILGVYNAYNRVAVMALNRDSTSSWTKATTTWEPLNVAGTGSGLNNAISWVDGLQRSTVDTSAFVIAGGGTTASLAIGLNLDSTSATPSPQGMGFYGTGIAGYSTPFVRTTFLPQIGFHFVQAVQGSFNTTSSAFYGSGWGGGIGQTEALELKLEM